MKNIFLSYFACGGGASLGAKLAGYQTIGVEIDPQMAELYRTNVGECFVEDVTTFNPQKLNLPSRSDRKYSGQKLVWQLSPPCQDHSRANKNRNNQSDRATIIRQLIGHEAIIQPDAIIVENVPEYFFDSNYQLFKGHLRERGYKIFEHILNAADFGVPQSRERLIAIAKRGGEAPIAIPNNCKPPTIIKTHGRNAINEQLSLFGDTVKPWIGWHDAIKHLIPSLPQCELTKNQQDAIKRRNNSTPLLVERVGYYDRPKVAAATEPSWTIRACLCDPGKDRGSRTNVINTAIKSDIRSLNTKALATLQSFPPEYQWTHDMKTNVRAIGNAVPPRLMQAVIESFEV